MRRWAGISARSAKASCGGRAKGGENLTVVLKGEPEEIAALVLAVQRRQLFDSKKVFNAFKESLNKELDREVSYQK